MEKTINYLGTTLAVISFAAITIHASTIFSEDFQYKTGSLVGQGGWADGGGSGTGTVSNPTLTPFASGGLVVPSSDSKEASISGKTLFRGLGLHTANSISNTFFISFLAQAGSGSNGLGGIRLKDTTTNKQMHIGQLLRKDKNAFWGVNVEGSDIGGKGVNIKADYSSIANTTAALLIAEIIYTDNTTANINLYVNPVVSSSPGSMSLLTPPVAALTGIILGNGFNQILVLANTDSTLAVDAIKIGTTLSDVIILAATAHAPGTQQ